MGGAHDQERYQRCFHEWVEQQEADLSELLQALAGDREADAAALHSLMTKSLQHFEDYGERRSRMSREDALAFFSPTWCTALENSFLWIAGCRPSLGIRLLYALCGNEVEDHLEELLQGRAKEDGLGSLSAQQLQRVEELHRSTVGSEEKLDQRMASLQDGVADNPLVRMSRTRRAAPDAAVSEAVGRLGDLLADILGEADRLRVATLRDLVGILGPRQSVEFLAATKQLHLSIHDWGLKTDRARCGGPGDSG
ncbi:hypothetical protein Taro_030588 [Colocasia esculenta]|uniref:DOG1 domain-containing protein n=1 Tax=Colocasia esculenta TaxID=4460 RepID=A0A843VPJ3_COLES|nr:hypothetical protein [Colocasia esculenta]